VIQIYFGAIDEHVANIFLIIYTRTIMV
jgi:hypothetical protein